MSIYALDVESTGLANHPTRGHPKVIELAIIPLNTSMDVLLTFIASNPIDFVIDQLVSDGDVERFRPSMKIDKRATEVHGIMYRDLHGCESSTKAILPQDTEYIVGHNIQYDYRCLGKPEGIKRVCTLNLAKKLDKKFGIGFKNHKLDTLILYYYGEDARDLVDNSHAALYDTVKVILLLAKLVEFIPNVSTVEELYDFQELLKKK